MYKLILFIWVFFGLLMLIRGRNLIMSEDMQDSLREAAECEIIPYNGCVAILYFIFFVFGFILIPLRYTKKLIKVVKGK